MVEFVVKIFGKKTGTEHKSMSFYNLYGQIYGQCMFVMLDLYGVEPRFADYAHLRKNEWIYFYNYIENEK